MNQKRLLHLDWYPALNASWILRVLSVLHACKSPALKGTFSALGSRSGSGTHTRDLAFAVATKLTMVPLIVQRVDARLKDIETILQSDR